MIPRRRGVAVEPQPLMGEQVNNGTLPPAAEGSEEGVTAEGGEPAEQQKEETLRPVEEEQAEIETPNETEPAAPAATEQSKEHEANEERTKKLREEAKQGGPLEAVLHMQPPEVVAKQHPAMSPPPYVHHFDSYSLVRQLQDGGYSKEHATTAMKGIRTILLSNLNVAQSSLVSKSDVENVSSVSGFVMEELR